MLLKTMMPDSLVHMTASEIALDITIINESYIIKTNLNSVLFKALRSAPGDTDSQNCLAELSVTLHMEAKSDTTQPLQLRTVVGQVFKPQMMLTEEFLTKSPQAQFAELSKVTMKTESIRDHVDMAIKIYNGFFHYHHEETSIVLDMTQMSSAVSSAACPGFHMQVSQVRVAATIKAAVGLSVLLHVKNVIATYSMSQSALTVDLMKVVYLRYTGPSLALKKVKEVSTPVLHVHEVKANFGEGKKLEREAFKGLSLPVNRGWGISFESFEIVFPYKYNFAACYEEVLNTVKWLKLVHKIKKKSFTVDSPLPPDLRIKAKLLKDEVIESKKRTEVMDSKLEQLLKTKNIPVNKREELYANLYKKSSDIYIQRSKQMYSNRPATSQLLTWLMEDIEIVALADLSYHGRRNVIDVMKEIDKDSPPPTDDMEFTSLWCRSVKFSLKQWSVSLRDFPQPMIDITNMHVWGRLIDLKTYTLAYGVCWEPAVALFNLAMDLISKPSVDPSRPLPFWDKMRLLLHGRLTMAIARMSWLVGLEWLCLGDPNDHHSVMPCAPDKVPDFSLEEHDSFRKFRSQNLNLDLSLKTKPDPSNPKNIPSAPEFYASSLRFLEKIKVRLPNYAYGTAQGPYRKIRLVVDFHRFVISHWMSNAKQHGAELVADSFQLRMCNRLTLVPIEDGLLHRPEASWSIKISYHRAESRNPKPELQIDPEQAHKTPRHSVAIHEMRGAWNERNRAVVLGLYDSYMKAQALRRNLSSEALKGFKVEQGQSGAMRNRSFSLNSPQGEAQAAADPTSPSPLSKLQTGHAHSMLLKLVSESDSKSVAFTEEPSNSNMELLHGVKACQPVSILSTNWLIELHNSQVMVKGCETPGFLIISMARAKVISYIHMPIWRASQLRSKSTWTGNVDCMQYYATVDPDFVFKDDNIPWLSRENVEDRSGTGLTGLPEMVSSGQSVGSVVSSTVPVPASEQPAEDTDVMTQEQGVDTFTLLHESVHAYSNSVQFTVIMDIVNNLLLYVEPKKKEASEKLQSMRFKLQLSRDEDQKKPILQQQEVVSMQGLEVEMEEVKNWINTKNEELSMRISCYNESQLQMRAQMKIEKAQQAHVVRRNEVCFKYAKWRLTERDGHCGIAEVELRNFVYTKVNRDDNTWTHQLELGWVKMENLLSDSFYQRVLMPRDPLGQDGENRQMLLRIFCSEHPPVGGIPVKEHFEVNVAPIQIQMTYQLYKAVMQYFFPDKNIETDDDDELEGGKKKGDKKASKKDREKEKEPAASMKKNPSFSSADEIHKMRERAAKNNTFLYVKVPEVQARVSYKGEKEKNIEDVHDFSFVLPTMEYHNCIWTWFDFFIVMKNMAKRVVLSQARFFENTQPNGFKFGAIKQKLHMRSRLTEEPPVTDVQEEQDKAKMLLGAKLLAGQDKPSKKGFFSKSHKS
nr:hypothetical protein BaRGS_006623 [Batillaria attramentaria]